MGTWEEGRATRRGLLEPDPTRLAPTELGRRFLNDLQTMFLNAPRSSPGRPRNVPEVAPLVRSQGRWLPAGDASR